MERNSDEAMGTGEVHTHIGIQPSGEERVGSDDVSFRTPIDSAPSRADAGAREESRGRYRDAGIRAADRARELAAQTLGSREELRARAGTLLGQAGSRIEQTGPIARARENPLTTIGIAFAVGFLLAGRSDTSGRFGKTKQQLRGAIIGAISTAVAQEARNLLGGEGGGLLGSLLGNHSGEDDDPDELYDEYDVDDVDDEDEA